MPFSIPTYFALALVQNTNLHQRRYAMKKFLKSRFMFVSTFPVIGAVENYKKFV
jgi:hypothetical protein